MSDREAAGPDGKAEPKVPPPKVDPETLVLRSQPRPVTRFNRRVVILVAGGALALILGITLIALQPPSLWRKKTGEELYNTNQKPTAEGLASLPRSYADLPVPKLGPPLSGDLGPPTLAKERELGIAPAAGPSPDLAFRPNPQDDIARSERLRRARQAEQAAESGVFFQISTKPGQGAPGALPRGESAGQPPETATPNAAAAPSTGVAQDQNRQDRKLAFLATKPDESIYNPHGLQDPASPYQVMAGTVIAAGLVTGINSDLPGLVIAQVTANVYDTATGKYLLIPQGARILGRYDSVIAFGQHRALVVWDRIVMPDGSSIVIDNLPATDPAGYAGLEDSVDYHTWRLVTGVALSTLLGVGTQVTFGNNEGDLLTALRESAQQNVNQAGQRITERNLDIQPTITIRPGWPLRIIVDKDLVLRPYRGQKQSGAGN